VSDINDSGTTRRTLIAGAGAAGIVAAGVVAGTSACGSGSGSQGGSAPGGSTAGAADGSLGKTGDIPVGGGKVFDSQKVVVTQPAAGSFKASSAVCTHQGCVVASINNGIIQCPCHGSQYSIADGSVKAGPAPKPLAAKTVSVKNGEIFVS
jgi:Rieske Fe-S protein